MTHDFEALAAALQLLIGDLPDADKRALFYKAFPNSFIMISGNAQHMQQWVKDALSHLCTAQSMADGSSPLGVVAVVNLRNELVAAKDNITAVRQTLGV